VPVTGEKFLRGLITPIDPKNIFFMLQSGYATDFILAMAVESLNGVRNRSAVGGTVREAYPDFTRALDLLREVQAAGAFGMRVEKDKVKGSTGVVFFRRDDGNADIAQKGEEIRQLLSERPSGTLREDYSEGGAAWNLFTHDQARSRAYRWGEDGIAGAGYMKPMDIDSQERKEWVR
jgi:hypothetical protein